MHLIPLNTENWNSAMGKSGSETPKPDQCFDGKGTPTHLSSSFCNSSLQPHIKVTPLSPYFLNPQRKRGQPERGEQQAPLQTGAERLKVIGGGGVGGHTAEHRLVCSTK